MRHLLATTSLILLASSTAFAADIPATGMPPMQQHGDMDRMPPREQWESMGQEQQAAWKQAHPEAFRRHEERMRQQGGMGGDEHGMMGSNHQDGASGGMKSRHGTGMGDEAVDKGHMGMGHPGMGMMGMKHPMQGGSDRKGMGGADHSAENDEGGHQH